MTTEERREPQANGMKAEEERGRLPFDRQEWARRNAEAQDSLRRQYGREVRGHADD